MFTTGFTMEASDHAESMDGESVAWMKLIAQDYGITLCGSLIIEDDGSFFNRLVWASPGPAMSDCYDKRHLFRMAGEHERYAAGRERRIFTLNGWRICPLVCYDLRFPAWCRGINEFDLQIFVANWPAARRSAWTTLLPARAVENQCYTLGVNRIGTDGNDVQYAGESQICDFFGNLLIDCEDRDTVTTQQLNGDALERYRRKFPAYLDADRFEIDR